MVTWREPLGRGLLAIAVSVVFLVFPHTTAATIAFGFGIWAFFDGIFVLLHGLRNPPTSGRWSTMIVYGVTEIVIGVVAFLLASATAATIGTFIGGTGILAGILAVLSSYRGAQAPREREMIVAGISGIVAGLIIVCIPLAVIVAQIWTVAAYGVALGCWFLIYAFNSHRRNFPSS